MPDNDNENIVITNYTENDIDQLSSTSGIIIDLNQRSIASLTNAPLSDLIDILDTTIKFEMDFRFVYENKSFKDDEEERQFIAQLYNEQAVKDSFKAVLNQILNEIDSKDFYEAWPLYNENGDQIIGKVVISSDMQQITPTQYSIFTNENSEEEEEEFIPSGKYCDCCGAYINTPAGESYFGTLNPSNSTHEGEHSYCYNCHEAICMSKDHITEFNALSGDLYVIKDSDGSIFYYCYDHKELSGTNSSCIKVIELPPTLSPSPYDNENPPEPESIPSPTPVE